jgi:hypothetical protein
MLGFNKNSLKALALLVLAAVAVLWLAPRPAPSPEAVAAASRPDTDEEKARNAKCARDVCAIILSKEANGPDVSCDLAHRWQAKEINGLAEAKDISWSLGPARCTLKINARRADILTAVTSPEHTLKISGQSVACEVGAERYDVSADVTADFTLKDGVVTAISLGGSDYAGPIFIAKTLYTAWGMEKKFGSFQGDMLREANRFIKKECPKALANNQAKK